MANEKTGTQALGTFSTMERIIAIYKLSRTILYLTVELVFMFVGIYNLFCAIL